MAKSNPLFVDSTLLRGDSIGTQIELHDVLLFDGEAIYLLLLTENDEEICMPLTPTTETSYEVYVRLVHQRPVKFYFGIAKDGELLYRTENYERIAVYALIESWTPMPIYQPTLKSATVAEQAPPEDSIFAETPSAAVPDEATAAGTIKESVPLAGLNDSHARQAPVLMADEVLNITSLLQKWGFN